MDPPTLREIELETLLRERGAQITILTDEVSHLRRFLSKQPGPSASDSVSLPPALLAFLQSHIHEPSTADAESSSCGSNAATAALMQRTRLLQEENDELYDLLRLSETGQLKEEVRCLRRVVSRLERALTESHTAIASLSSELDKSYDSFQSRQNTNQRSQANSHSPSRNSFHSSQASAQNNSQNLRPIPTGPRAYKKPRLSESQPSTARSNTPLPNPNLNAPANLSRNPRRDRSPRGTKESRKTAAKTSRMDIDEGTKTALHSPRERPKEVDRERSRERDRDRDREKDRDKDRSRLRERDGEGAQDRERKRERERDRSRRNGAPGAGGGGRRAARNNILQGNGDRTLAERMGL